VSALVLRQVVAARELLTAVSALEGLVVSVQRAVVALEVFLAAEATRAKSADEGLGGILSQRLLATTAAGRCHRGGAVLVRAGVDGIVGVGRLTLVVRLSIAVLSALLLGRTPLGCGRGGHVVRNVTLSRGQRQAVAKLLFEVGEALVAYEILLRGERDKVSALALTTEELCVLGTRERNKTGKVVLAVKLEERLESWQTVEVKGLGGVGEVDLGCLALEDYLVLLVTWAEREM